MENERYQIYGDREDLELDVREATKERIRYCYDNADTIVVCFSGGKDSTALLNVALEVATELDRLPLKVFHADEECTFADTVDYVRRVADDPRVEFVWSCVPLKHRNALSRSQPWYLTWDPEKPELWAREMPDHPSVVTTEDRPDIPYKTVADQIGYFYGPENGTVVQMLGRRSQESLTRLRLVTNRGGWDGFISKASMAEWKHIRTADPIYDWATEDVWIAPHVYGWDYNRVYDRFHALGIPLPSQRVAPPFGEEPAGTLWTWRLVEPALWDRMVDRVPGAATGARYYRTKLYNRREADFGPADGETWAEYVQSIVMQWGPETRSTVANNIRICLSHHRHCAKGRPMPERTHDPDSGLSWSKLAKIASRGMLKSRTLTQQLGSNG